MRRADLDGLVEERLRFRVLAVPGVGVGQIADGQHRIRMLGPQHAPLNVHRLAEERLGLTYSPCDQYTFAKLFIEINVSRCSGGNTRRRISRVRL